MADSSGSGALTEDKLTKTMMPSSTEEQSREFELDWTNKLPDELLVNVLSRLTMEEAIRTSVLSSRWKDLWKFADLELDFDATNELLASDNLEAFLLPEQRQRFDDRVNDVVMQMHNNAPKLAKFRVYYHLASSNVDYVDRWLDFAISKRLDSLHLAFNLVPPQIQSLPIRAPHYVFPQNCYSHVKTPQGLSQIKLLRSLRLIQVDVSSEILEHFITNCPLLEELVVVSSPTLTELRLVAKPLKRLEVRRCRILKYLEIDHASHLARFEYDGACYRGEFRVSNCPSLVELFLHFGTSAPGVPTLKSLSCYASQLKSIGLDLALKFMPGVDDVLEYAHLERLTVGVLGQGNGCLLRLIPLINACPRLHTLQVFLHTRPSTDNSRQFMIKDNVVKIRRGSIRVVEIVGFSGYVMEREFMEYVLEYFVGLERIVIDRSFTARFSMLCYGSDSVCKGQRNLCPKEIAGEAQKLALEFKSKAPSTIEFVVK